ncbi:MAG: hypothetical protein ACJA0X_000045 [Cyclobacteriaceae bacterium]|jgi:hypothetical protein
MKRRLLIILFFIVVFGFPISWYFILQVFGENQFELPVIRTLDKGCFENDNAQAFLFIRENGYKEDFNLSKRINKKLSLTELNIQLSFDQVCLNEKDMIFVDSTGRVRGEFDLNREDIDRLFAEMDIYMLNIKRNKNE